MAITSRDVENVLRTVFKRCVQCDNDQAPACPPSCPAGQMCVQTPPSCSACAFTNCVAETSDPTNKPSQQQGGPNVGAIAGGTVGGVVFVAIVVFIIWKFVLKGRRQQPEEGEWQEVDVPAEKTDVDFASRRSTRASTHTVASMASSVLTRASNIIQIAYIPGVTNRSGPGSPDLLVPPVPPIPAMSPSTALSSPYPASEQHFFVPELRDSTYSASTEGARSSYARTSIAPSLARSSTATTIYRNNAIVSPLPAQTIVRGKAAVVSVKSNGSNSPIESPGSETPPVPLIDAKHTNKPVRIQMPGMMSSGSTATASTLSREGSVRSTATLGPVRALNITKKKASPGGSTPKSSHSAASTPSDTTIVPAMRPLTEISVASTDDDVSHSRARRAGSTESDSESEDDDHSRARRSLLRTSSNPRDSDITEIQDTPSMMQSPFSDSSEEATPHRFTSTSGGLRPPLTPVVEESSKRESKASKRTQSPFSDDNEI